MALDVERNWAAELAERKFTNLIRGRTLTMSASDECPGSACSYMPSTTFLRKHENAGQVVHLPPEIILYILSFIPVRPENQSTLCTCCLLSRDWYSSAIPLLYRSPSITSKNFRLFVRTICPSINVHVRKSELAGLVRRLDMGSLVHDGSKSVTARLLGRVKEGLEEFVAPQTSFAYVPNSCGLTYEFIVSNFLQHQLPGKPYKVHPPPLPRFVARLAVNRSERPSPFDKHHALP